MNRGIITLVVIATVITISFASAQSNNGYGCFGWSMMGGYNNFGFMWLFGMIFWLLVLVALILLIVWLVRQLQMPRRRK